MCVYRYTCTYVFMAHQRIRWDVSNENLNNNFTISNAALTRPNSSTILENDTNA